MPRKKKNSSLTPLQEHQSRVAAGVKKYYENTIAKHSIEMVGRVAEIIDAIQKIQSSYNAELGNMSPDKQMHILLSALEYAQSLLEIFQTHHNAVSSDVLYTVDKALLEVVVKWKYEISPNLLLLDSTNRKIAEEITNICDSAIGLVKSADYSKHKALSSSVFKTILFVEYCFSHFRQKVSRENMDYKYHVFGAKGPSSWWKQITEQDLFLSYVKKAAECFSLVNGLATNVQWREKDDALLEITLRKDDMKRKKLEKSQGARKDKKSAKPEGRRGGVQTVYHTSLTDSIRGKVMDALHEEIEIFLDEYMEGSRFPSEMKEVKQELFRWCKERMDSMQETMAEKVMQDLFGESGDGSNSEAILKHITKSVNGLFESNYFIQTVLKPFDIRINEYGQKIQKLEKALSSMQSKVEAASKSAADANNSLSTQSLKLTKLEQQVNSKDAEISSIKKQQADASATLTSLDARVKKMEESSSDLDERLKPIEDFFGALARERSPSTDSLSSIGGSDAASRNGEKFSKTNAIAEAFQIIWNAFSHHPNKQLQGEAAQQRQQQEAAVAASSGGGGGGGGQGNRTNPQNQGGQGKNKKKK